MKKMKKWLSLIVICLMAVICIQCGKGDPESEDLGTGTVVGNWDNSTYLMKLYSNGSYDAYLSSAPITKVVWGTYSVSGSQISITDTGGIPFPAGGSYACDFGQVGVYSFVLTSTTLDLNLISDDCDGRKLGVAAVFTKM